MENIIDDYNSILEHKHIMKEGGKNLDYGQLKPSPSQQHTENLLIRIAGKKKELQRADLSTQVKLNKQIANLYREFYNYDRNKNMSIVANGERMGNASMLDHLENGLKRMKSDHQMGDKVT